MKIDFNVPPYVGNEMEYIQQAVDVRKICGDGQFTNMRQKWQQFFAILSQEMK